MTERVGTLRLPRSGYAYYGQSVGIIVLSDGLVAPEEGAPVPIDPATFCRIPGDVGNATTFGFPVQYKLVHGVAGRDLLRGVPTPACAQAAVRACRELEAEGVRAIATFCGFMAYLQPEMAAAVDIPVFSSAVMQVPLVAAAVAPRRVAVLTASSEILTREHMRRCGVTDESSYVIWGMERYDDDPDRTLWVAETDPDRRLAELERRVSQAAVECVSVHPEVGAFVLECTNMPPAASAVQRATGMPVWDVTTLVELAHAAVTRHRFAGYM